jgi:predicted metal-dependent peptidase
MESIMTEHALDRVLKARVELLLTSTFYGVLLGQTTPVISEKIPTAATDGKRHYWNPDFLTTLTQDELLGVQAHESEHDARRHHTRRGHRDPVEWNIACDYAINPDVLDQGFKLPKDALVDFKYRGMSAEDIFRSREIERMEEARKANKAEAANGEEEESQNGEAEDSASEEADSQGSDGTGSEKDQGADENQDNDADGDEGQNGGTESSGTEGSGEEKGDGSDDDGTGNGNGTDAGTVGTAGEGGADGQGATRKGKSRQGLAGEPVQDGAGATESGEGGTPTPDAENATSAAPGAPETAFPGDYGNSCGCVMDCPGDPAEIATADATWEVTLRQATMLAAKRGDHAPGHIARLLEHADHPPQDWRETLRAFFDGGATSQETWSRPNRRMIASGTYMPGRVKDGLNKLMVLIDTSGSVTYFPGALEAIKTEVQAALDEQIIDEMVVVYGDVAVTRTDTYRSGDEVEFDPRGGGDTVMKPLFDYVANEHDDASAIVAFTDLFIEPEYMLGPEPQCPVMWAVVGMPAEVKRHLANTPWKAPGIEVRPDVN